MSTQQSKPAVDTFQALGEFVVNFSALLYALENSTIHLISMGPQGPIGVPRVLLDAVLTDRTASPIANAFFSVFAKKWEGQIKQNDQAVLKKLRQEIQDLVTTRNRLMHDAWLMPVVGGDTSPQNFHLRRVRAHGGGVQYEGKDITAEYIRELAENAIRLTRVVWATTYFSHDEQAGPELHPRISIVDDQLVLI